MRKALSIFLLIIFLLYHVGYVSVYWLASHQIDSYWNSMVSYDGPLEKISVEVKLPYWADQDEYTPSSGSFILDGKTYRALFQKYSGDSLHFLVVQDQLTMHLNTSIKDWIQKSTASDTEQKDQTKLKSVTKDYKLTDELHTFVRTDFEYLSDSKTLYLFNKVTFIPEISSPPPQA